MTLKAVVFDWAGTMVDFGSRAPVEAFLTLFREFGMEITDGRGARAHGPHKIDHIREYSPASRESPTCGAARMAPCRTKPSSSACSLASAARPRDRRPLHRPDPRRRSMSPAPCASAA